jgi:hypothetical protein
MEGPLEQLNLLQGRKSPESFMDTSTGFSFDPVSGLDLLQYSEPYGMSSLHSMSIFPFKIVDDPDVDRYLSVISPPWLRAQPRRSHVRVHLHRRPVVHRFSSCSSFHTAAICQHLPRCALRPQRRRDVVRQHAVRPDLPRLEHALALDERGSSRAPLQPDDGRSLRLARSDDASPPRLDKAERRLFR